MGNISDIRISLSRSKNYWFCSPSGFLSHFYSIPSYQTNNKRNRAEKQTAAKFCPWTLCDLSILVEARESQTEKWSKSEICQRMKTGKRMEERKWKRDFEVSSKQKSISFRALVHFSLIFCWDSSWDARATSKWWFGVWILYMIEYLISPSELMARAWQSEGFGIKGGGERGKYNPNRLLSGTHFHFLSGSLILFLIRHLQIPYFFFTHLSN